MLANGYYRNCYVVSVSLDLLKVPSQQCYRDNGSILLLTNGYYRNCYVVSVSLDLLKVPSQQCYRDNGSILLYQFRLVSLTNYSDT